MITYEMLEDQRTMAIELKELKEREMDLRRKIADELGGDNGPGTYKSSQDGFNIVLKLGVSYSLDQEELVDLMDRDLLTDEELELIRTKYDLKLADYKKSGNTETLDDVIIVKPSAPTLLVTLGES